eukprot:CAMPEP_0201682026 /NCGR_PEP_ID=MMETSP0494-20130426/51408_1 /ASSEMBLY_ACC=CAM_ASM_000839 /TAXON_ID=420259 /ORGANISM="Thalassiosira gravida, Strain GMp14c1" /LENGTH=539 /DNA_ID=CAMNT_0048165779 /DNA_START=338 /DNA_END=1957 /DNA_ORIENTATION=-
MIPNPNIWSTLFELARIELNFPKDQIVAKRIDTIAIDNFFKFNSGGIIGYTTSSSSPSALDTDGNNSTKQKQQQQQHHASMAYLRIFKAGNDQIRFNLMDTFQKSKKSGQTTVAASDKSKISDMMTMLDNETCIVTAVRDPIERFLSGYSEVEYRREVANKKHKQKTIGSRSTSITYNITYHTAQTTHNIDATVTAAAAAADGPNYTHWGNGTTRRFEQFVTDFIGGPQSNGLYRYKKYGIQEIEHVFSMSGILWGLKRYNDCHNNGLEDGTVTAASSSSYVTLTGYLPSLHNLNMAFPKFLSETCRLKLHDLAKPFDKQIMHESQSDPFHFHSAAKQVWTMQGNISRALCIIHALDYACFDMLPIPGVCQTVYEEEWFRDGLMNALSNGRKKDVSSDSNNPPPSCPSSSLRNKTMIAGGGAAALAKLRSMNNTTMYRTALVTAVNLLGDIVSHPQEETYRTIDKSNTTSAFALRLGSLPGGSDLMLALGFTIHTKDNSYDNNVEYYILIPTADAWPKVVTAHKMIQLALREDMREITM